MVKFVVPAMLQRRLITGRVFVELQIADAMVHRAIGDTVVFVACTINVSDGS